MKTKYACDLGEGDVIQLPKNLVASKATIKSIEVLPTADGDVLVFDLESKGIHGWTMSKAKIGFRYNQKIDCIPLHVPLSKKIFESLSAFYDWCFPKTA